VTSRNGWGIVGDVTHVAREQEVGYEVPNRANVRVSETKPLVDAYFSADVETDGPIPGPFSMLSFALVFAGTYDGRDFQRPASYDTTYYAELRPISNNFQAEALAVNGLDRARLCKEGRQVQSTLSEVACWVREVAGAARPVLVAYPLSFDWTWLYWYFVSFSDTGSPFAHSSCYDIKTAFAVKGKLPVARAGRSSLLAALGSSRVHTHHALDDAIEQAEIFANVFEWDGRQDEQRAR
jgi:hypothetical protein